MMQTEQPFFVRGNRVGTVVNIETNPSFNRGILRLDDCSERSVFEAVVSLARTVDVSEPDEYQSSWDAWRRGCDELQDLHLWIGDGRTQIEEFTIESNWSIEWQNMDDYGIV
jgi:hypothetical protein